MILNTKHLSIGYKRSKAPVVVQQDISVELHEGEVVCLIGPNGCGKSTLLRTLAGLQPPLGGNVFINGQDFLHQSASAKSLLLGLVLTEQVSIGKMTVTEMVALGRYPHTDWIGKLSPIDEDIINNSIKQVNLAHKADELYNELSDGEKQRVMIAKALAQDTPIVLLDEPTAHLDLPNRVEIMLLLRQLAKQTNKSILLSTHELDLALQAADRIWLMQKNSLHCGLPEELVINGNLQAVFENNSFTFDDKTGNFIMNYPAGKTVKLTGDDVICYWTKRALAREGFQIAVEAPVNIIAGSGNSFVCDKGGEVKTFSTLTDLMTYLRGKQRCSDV